VTGASNRPSFFASFTRSQLASLAATVIDFSTLVFLVEVGGVWYVLATAVGAALGSLTNFTLGRHWTFKATDGKLSAQALRYALVSGTSLILNSLGVFSFTEFLGLPYAVSKGVTSLLVGFLFNFPMQRNFVFK